MKQITEDYVSYKTAKLLKDKGVDFINCVTYYCEDKPKEVNYSFCGETNSTWEKRCCQAPTLQMALKWLREVYKIHISVYTYDEYSCDNYQFDVYKNNNLMVSRDDGHMTHEQACEAAIKYCLENLI